MVVVEHKAPTNCETMNRTPSTTQRTAGFTLVELLLVVVLMGILAASVVPAMDNLSTIREGAARDDVARMLQLTRARALASGTPNGLRVNLGDSSLELVRVPSGGGVSAATDPLTGNERGLDIDSTYQDVTLASMINGDGVQGDGVVWFDYTGAPHTRNANGNFVSSNTENVILSLSSGAQVIVYPRTGLVDMP